MSHNVLLISYILEFVGFLLISVPVFRSYVARRRLIAMARLPQGLLHQLEEREALEIALPYLSETYWIIGGIGLVVISISLKILCYGFLMSH
ncbi:hypothetical protein [Ancylobacter lacus]|uniref:hypothetical protein n=1 Tax=Ancylobacter lacus TaxID=2579970 RepID=UPI001BD0D34B|nr:hypothetical protein [Ancylobacter lacus]MBS7539249.1 hypothetical protein [Ancylobacter lacus]